MNLSIVIPVHNESANIGRLIEEIAALPLESICEIVIVNDASTDDTCSVLTSIQAKVAGLQVLQHRETYGQSAAIITGIRHARGEIIVTLDGDGQNDPADIPVLLDILQKNKNITMVTGHRQNRQDRFYRIISSKIANRVRQVFLKDDTPDTGCGLKIFYKEAFMALPFFDHMHRFLPALIKMQNGEVVSIKVNHRSRQYGRSNYGMLQRLAAGIVDLLGVFWLRCRTPHISLVEKNNE